MADTQEQELNNPMGTFMRKKGPQENSLVEQAQRLVNLYHHLSVFGPDFGAQYNQMLLDAPPDVQTMLNSIIGGPVVRQYLDFLKKQTTTAGKSETSDEKTSFSGAESYLPSPEEDFMGPLTLPTGIPDTTDSSHHINALMKAMKQMQQAEAERQTAFLQQALEKMQSVLLQQIHNTQPTAENSEKNRLEQTQLLNQTVEKIVKAQTDVLVQAFQKASENTRVLAARQTNRLMDYLKKREKEGRHYSDVIETAQQQMTPQAPSATAPLPPKPPIIPPVSQDTTEGGSNA